MRRDGFPCSLSWDKVGSAVVFHQCLHFSNPTPSVRGKWFLWKSDLKQVQLLPGPVDFSKGIFSTSERNSWGLHNKKLMTQFSLCLCLNWDTSIFLKKGLKFESYFLLTPQVGNFLQHRLLGLVWNSVTEYFPSMHEVLNSVFRTKKKKKKK